MDPLIKAQPGAGDPPRSHAAGGGGLRQTLCLVYIFRKQGRRLLELNTVPVCDSARPCTSFLCSCLECEFE
ncbi:hypothetical protein E2C01_049045 [Portunus trituberculatus]|uniref:Uncharacterized protein n=1 Tax=Portunus trituberculatus TaxID=210409 RepID=A0A5B7G566_PORTR|nr:hypothetical protein [Portunus trituberculatus]